MVFDACEKGGQAYMISHGTIKKLATDLLFGVPNESYQGVFRREDPNVN